MPVLSWETAACPRGGLWSLNTDVYIPGQASVSLMTLGKWLDPLESQFLCL